MAVCYKTKTWHCEILNFSLLSFMKHLNEPWNIFFNLYNFLLSGFNSHQLRSSHRQVLSGSCICFKKPLSQFSTAALWPLKVKCWKYCPPQLDRSSSAFCTPQVLQEGLPAGFPSAPAVSDWWAPQTVTVGTVSSCFRGSAFAISYTETTQGGVPQSMRKNKSRGWTEIRKPS